MTTDLQPIVPTSPLGRPNVMKGQKLPALPLTPEEFQRLVRSCSRRTLAGKRAAALLVFGRCTGVRVAEALAIKPEDLDLEAGFVQILHGKGGTRRTLPLSDTVIAVLLRWLDVRRELGVGARAPLFCTRKGTRMATSAIRRMLPKLAERAGITKRVHFHGLRHAMTQEMRETGIRLETIQRQLGHASLASTGLYVARLSPTELAEALVLREAQFPVLAPTARPRAPREALTDLEPGFF